VVFLTELDTLGLPEDLAGDIKRSDVKGALQVAAAIGGRRRGSREGERPRLDEENEYDLFVDAVVCSTCKKGAGLWATTPLPG